MTTTVNNSLHYEIKQDTENKDWVKNLPKLLRTIGSIAILASLYLFLVKGWEGSSDLVRYMMLLSHTGLLTGIALFSGHYLKEAKGARLLLMLAQVSVVVNFAILGAFILSNAPGIDLAAYPHYVAWSVNSFGTALLTTGMAMLLLVPIVWFGFRSLGRNMSKELSILFTLSNIALLIPLRDPVTIAILSIFLGLYTLFVTAKLSMNRTEVKTLEGMIVILLQFLPLIVLVGRNIWLYSLDYSLYTAATIMAFIAIRQCALLINESALLRGLSEISTLILAACTCDFAYLALTDGGLHESVSLILSCLLTSGMVYEMSFRKDTNPGMYRSIAIAITVAGFIINLLIHDSMATSIIALSLGILSISISYILQQRSLFVGGMILVITGSIDQFMHIFQYFDFGYWITLAIFGTLAIIAGSVLESKGGQIKQQIQTLRTSFSEWSY
jgi:hypothetical protein